MDRKSFKSEPFHVKRKHNGEVDEVVFPADTRVVGTATLDDPDLWSNTLVFGHRLSVSGSSSVPVDNVASASALYLTPHASNCLALYNDSHWQLFQTNMVTRSLSDLGLANTNYDVFAYYDNSRRVVDLEFQAWRSNTVRNFELMTKDGVYVKNGDATRRYAGTVRTVAVGVIADAASRRFVWNYYNRTPRFLQQPAETTDSWTYAGITYRAANGQTANSFEFVTGDTELVNAQVYTLVNGGTSGWGASVGIGIDTTTSNNANIYGTITTAGTYVPAHAFYSGYPGVGYHRFHWLEISGGITLTYYGDVGNLTYFNFGLGGSFRA